MAHRAGGQFVQFRQHPLRCHGADQQVVFPDPAAGFLGQLELQFGGQAYPAQQPQRIVAEIGLAHRNHPPQGQVRQAPCGVLQRRRRREWQSKGIQAEVSPPQILLQAVPHLPGQIKAPAIQHQPGNRTPPVQHHRRAAMTAAQLLAEGDRIAGNHQI